MRPDDILKVDNLGLSFPTHGGYLPVLHGVSFAVPAAFKAAMKAAIDADHSHYLSQPPSTTRFCPVTTGPTLPVPSEVPSSRVARERETMRFTVVVVGWP